MKIIRDDTCFVDVEELTRYPLPKYIQIDKNEYEKGELVELNGKESVDYIKGRKDIVDYDEVSSLSRSDLLLRIGKLYVKLESLTTKYVSLPKDYRDALYNEEAHVNEYKLNNYICTSLLDYYSNRENVDEKMAKIVSKTDKRLVR